SPEDMDQYQHPVARLVALEYCLESRQWTFQNLHVFTFLKRCCPLSGGGCAQGFLLLQIVDAVLRKGTVVGAEAHQSLDALGGEERRDVSLFEIQMDEDIAGKQHFGDLLPAPAHALGLGKTRQVTGESLALQVQLGDSLLAGAGLCNVPVHVLRTPWFDGWRSTAQQRPGLQGWRYHPGCPIRWRLPCAGCGA